MDNTQFNTELNIHSKEYDDLLSQVIDEYNHNGRKTLLITCDTFYPVVDGVVNVMDNYAKQLSKYMNVIMLVPDYKGKVYMSNCPAIGIESGYSHKLHYQLPLPMLSNLHTHYLKKLRIDIIHCHSPFMISRVAMQLHNKRKIPLVNTFHSQYKQDFEKQAKPFVPILMKYIMKSFNSSNEVWTMHTASRDTLVSYGYTGKVVLMPNGTAMTPPVDYERERKDARVKYGISDDTTLFIFVGRLVTQKNILFNADVLAYLKQSGLKFKMLYVGDGPDKELLQQHIAELHLENEIVLLGQKDKSELPEIYAAADLFLFPSLYDVSSLVQVEAASRYTPTAFVEGSVTSCTVTNGVNGFILPNDTQMYAKGILATLSDKDNLIAVGKNAYRDLYITWDQLIKRVYNRYIELIEQNKRSHQNNATD